MIHTWLAASAPVRAVSFSELVSHIIIFAFPMQDTTTVLHSCLQVEKLKQSSALSKAAKKADKKASKEAKKEKKRAADQMGAALAAKGVGPPASSTQASYKTQADSDLLSRRSNPDPRRMHDSASRHQDQSYLRNSRARRDDSYSDHRDDSRRAHKQRRLHSPERTAEAGHHRHTSSDRQHDRSDRGQGRDPDVKHHNGHAAAIESRRHASRDVVSAHNSRHAANEHDKVDSAQTDSRSGKYGLSWGETAPEELQARDRCDHIQDIFVFCFMPFNSDSVTLAISRLHSCIANETKH